jgi:hypothetical protein
MCHHDAWAAMVVESEFKVLLVALLFAFAPVSDAAGIWKPLCIEGSACNILHDHAALDVNAEGPVVTGEGIWFQHAPVGSDFRYRDVFRFVIESVQLQDLGGAGGHVLSDASAVHLNGYGTLRFAVGSMARWSIDGDYLGSSNWTGLDPISLNNAGMAGPPVELGGSVYIGLRAGGGWWIYRSADGGTTWTRTNSNIRLGEDRFNLVADPDRTALWAIQSEFFELPASLWESLDEGATWYRIDDGSFPAQTVRIVHDPDHPDTSYALTARGLKVGRPDHQGRIHWQATAMWRAVHGLAFVDRIPPLSRALVIGTDTGVLVSVDEAKTWEPMAAGLLAIPHTVTWAHGMLVATSEAGYFTCNTVDCAGAAQPVPAEDARGPVTVTEFYHRDLDHYFMTASAEEAAGIDAGAAGPGWERTGQAFTAWSVLGNPAAGMNLCRFYGSVEPGPNSHFFTLSTGECSQLLDLQQSTPATEPRWNFEGYAFAAVPPAIDELAPCPEATVPVFRAYNGGFERGEDSNHRYVTDRALLGPLVARGWVEEGVAFCVAEE